MQEILASMKQSKWWKENAPDQLYKYDYLVALFMHGFSWTFSIMLIPTLYIITHGGTYSYLLFAINLLMHMWIDDLKANKRKINLIVDQTLHVIQIVGTWYVLIF